MNTTYWTNWPTAREPLRQRRLLAPHVRDGALESPADPVARLPAPTPGGPAAGRGREPWPVAPPPTLRAVWHGGPEPCHADYLLRRVGVFLLIAWLAATLNFFLPRLSGQDPVRVKLLQQAQLGGLRPGRDRRDGQGVRPAVRPRPAALGASTSPTSGMSPRLDFNYSIANYPRTVNAMIAEALPWTVALLGTTTVLSFALGTFLGALLAWPRAPRWMRWLMPPLWALHAIPFFLLGLILIYLFAFRFTVLPDVRRLQRWRLPGLDRGLRARRALARDPARPVHHPGGDGRVGPVDARHDGHHPGRGLRDLRRGQGAQEPHHLPPLLRPERAPSPGHGAGPGPRPDRLGRGPGRGHLRVSRHRLGAVPGDPGERPLPDPGHRVHRDHRARRWPP